MIFSLVIFILLATLGTFLILSPRSIPVCGDGTTYNNCSETEPYFCLNGTLLEKASICSCSDFSLVRGEKCFAKYQLEPKNISLNYTLRGEKGQINFTVYKNMSDYLSNIPRYLTPTNGEETTLLDFRLKSLNEKNQRKLLIPLAVAIKNIAKNQDDQARIAISLVQNIPFGSTNKIVNFLGVGIEYYRYPYEVLYDMQGVCGEKSALLVFLLRELGYGTSFLYYSKENHEATGIRCPIEKSLDESGYCFIETTGPSIITDSQTEYVTGSLTSLPEILPISGNSVFGETNFYEYNDAKILENIRGVANDYGAVNYIEHVQFTNLVKKYGLVTFEEEF